MTTEWTTGYRFYVQWAGSGPYATRLWDAAGMSARNADELDLFLAPFFRRVTTHRVHPLSPDDLERIAGEELHQLSRADAVTTHTTR